MGIEVKYILVKETEGYSIISTNLPGCVSQGESQVEALMNFCDAFKGCVELYIDECGEVPWHEDQGLYNELLKDYDKERLTTGSMTVELEDEFDPEGYYK